MMWPVSASRSYLFRDPDGTSTKTTTSVTRLQLVRLQSRSAAPPAAIAAPVQRPSRSATKPSASASAPSAATASPRDPGRHQAVAFTEGRDRAEQKLEERVRVDRHADVGVRRSVGAVPAVEDRPPSVELGFELDLDVRCSVRTIPGRNACASATASWIGAPSQPYVRRW